MTLRLNLAPSTQRPLDVPGGVISGNTERVNPRPTGALSRANPDDDDSHGKRGGERATNHHRECR
jgi:hypothetical protein